MYNGQRRGVPVDTVARAVNRNGVLGRGPRRLAARLFAVVLGFALGFACVTAQADEPPRRIYLLEGLAAAQPAGVSTRAAFEQRLKERSSEHFEIFTDFLELGRFPGAAHEARMVRLLSGKYAQNPPALLVPISRGALQFLMQNRSSLAPATPIVYCCVDHIAADAMNLPRDVTGVVTQHDWAKTLALARGLQPDARKLVVVAGASDYDRAWREDALREIQPQLPQFEARYLFGLPYDDMLNEVSRLSADTIVLLVPVFADGTGQPRVPPEVAAEVSKRSPAPVYSPLATSLGQGIVGGYTNSYETQGEAAADLALDVLAGKDPASLPRQVQPQAAYQVDARQLAHWNLPEAGLPPGAVVLFKSPTFWEQHRAAAAVFGLQSLILAIVLIQMRKRQQAERSLKESEERMAFAAASTNIGLWQIELPAGRLWTTEHCRRMFGRAEDVELTTADIVAAVHPGERRSVESAIATATRRGSDLWSDFRVDLPHGEVRWIHARGHPRFDDHGKPIRLSGIFADITSRKQAEGEAQAQRDEIAHLMRVSVMGELSGAIAHELNQPLTAILANAQTARLLMRAKNPDAGMVSEILDDIVHEDNRATEVIQRLRSLMRRGERKSEPIDLNTLIESTLALLHSELIARGVRAEVALANDLPQVSGDSVQLQQVLLNLAMNAMDAMSATEPAQRQITLRTRHDGNGTVEAVVADRGRGLTGDERDRLFQPFFTTKEHGLGLGLSICSTIVKSHGGNLSIDNDAGGGAIAILALPSRPDLPTAS
jgi:PAS domain S-box-containing protein